MDKVEYKIRADEIKALIGEGRFAEAVKIADTIDWKRVKSVTMLCTISDLYKINRRFQESKDVLLMAYDRHPTGRAIVYSLCELAIKMGEFVQAVEYYKEFVRIAPRDTGRYILQYKLYEAQEVSLEERIAVLEEFKKHDYRERWAYELAYLYHRVGLTTECIEECDEMFLWFGDGRYVMKALELKALHEPLSPEQKDRYVTYKQSHGGVVDRSIVSEKDEIGKDETRTVEIKQPTKEMPRISDQDIANYNAQKAAVVQEDIDATREFVPGEISFGPVQDASAEPQPEEQPQERDFDEIVYPHISEIKEPSVDISTYNTINLQQSLAESLREVIGDDYNSAHQEATPTGTVQPITEEIFEEEDDVPEETRRITGSDPNAGGMQELSYSTQQTVQEQFTQQVPQQTVQEQFTQQVPQQIAQEQFTQQVPQQTVQEQFISQEPVEVHIPTLDDALEAEVQQKEALLNDKEDFDAEYTEEADQLPVPYEEEEFDVADTATLPQYAEPEKTETFISEPEEYEGEVIEQDEQDDQIPKSAVMQEVFFETSPKMGIEIKYGGMGPILGEEKRIIEAYEEKPLEEEVPGAVIHPNASYHMHNNFESMLAQESDGQLSMAVEPEPEVEKQITGQISISEYLNNWEQYKKDQQQKQLERVKKRVADETGDMFAEFDEKTKAGLQEKIEKAISEAIKKESYEKASGRGNWNIKREDVINEAVANVIDKEDDNGRVVYPEVPGQMELPFEEAAPEESASEEPVSAVEKLVEEELAVEEPDEPVKEEASEEVSQDTVPDMDFREVSKEEIPEETEKEFKENEVPDSSAKEVQADTSEEDDSDSEETSDNSEEEKEPVPEQKKDRPKESKKPASGKKHLGNRELEERIRTMTPEEKELFGPYIHHKKSRRQIINAIDNLSMDPFSGNAIVTGEEGAGTVNLAKGLIKAMQASDSNFSGKVAKITANTLNKKSTAGIFDKLANGALIIQRAADLKQDTVSELINILQEENKGLVLVMEDTKEDMDRFLNKNPSLKQSFNVRVDIEALDDDSLVAYARQYALEREYAIDNLGILALHTRISERQTLDHDVTVSEVKDIIDDAIYYAEKRSVGHFVDILVHKRYDENDMIILREKDFMHD